jgi:hypothetical protein
MCELMLQYYFEDRFDLVQFVRVVKDAGLYLMLRIGPFVAAEWNFGSVRPLPSVYCPSLDSGCHSACLSPFRFVSAV